MDKKDKGGRVEDDELTKVLLRLTDNRRYRGDELSVREWVFGDTSSSYGE